LEQPAPCSIIRLENPQFDPVFFSVLSRSAILFLTGYQDFAYDQKILYIVTRSG